VLLSRVEDKREFLQQMAQGFSSERESPEIIKLVLLITAAVLAFIFILNFTIRNASKIRGAWVFLFKKLGGRETGPPRYHISVDIVLDVPFDLEPVCHTTTANLSPSGMFVKINPPLKQREIFKFRLNLSKDISIFGSAEVMWVQDRWSEHHPTGIGCKFRNISDADRNKIRAWLKNQKRDRL
jgi:hypothetical protein